MCPRERGKFGVVLGKEKPWSGLKESSVEPGESQQLWDLSISVDMVEVIILTDLAICSGKGV